MFSLADQLLLGQTLVGARVRMIRPRNDGAFDGGWTRDRGVNRHEQPIGTVVTCMLYTPWSFNKTGETVVAFEVSIKNAAQVWYADEFEVITPAHGPTSV